MSSLYLTCCSAARVGLCLLICSFLRPLCRFCCRVFSSLAGPMIPTRPPSRRDARMMGFKSLLGSRPFCPLPRAAVFSFVPFKKNARASGPAKRTTAGFCHRAENIFFPSHADPPVDPEKLETRTSTKLLDGSLCALLHCILPFRLKLSAQNSAASCACSYLFSSPIPECPLANPLLFSCLRAF